MTDHRKTPAVPEPFSAGGPQPLAPARVEAVLRALENLPEPQRRILQLRYRDGLSFEDVSRALDLPPQAAMQLWWQAIGQLQDSVDPPA